MPVVNGILAASVYNPADGVFVPIRQISAGSFEFSQIDADYERSASGSRLGQADVSRCGFEFIDDGTIYAQLRAWQDARTRLSLVAIGASLAIQWYETDLIDVRPVTMGGVVQGRADRYVFEIFREGHGRHAIYKQQNLLAHLGWNDTDASGVVDGYDDFGDWADGDYWDAVNQVQEMPGDVETDGLRVDIPFPIGAGFSFRLSSEITDLHSSPATSRVLIQYGNFAKSTFTGTVTTASATGRAGVSYPTLSDRYWIRCIPMEVPAGISGGNTMGCRYPALRVDGQDIYTPG